MHRKKICRKSPSFRCLDVWPIQFIVNLWWVSQLLGGVFPKAWDRLGAPVLNPLWGVVFTCASVLPAGQWSWANAPRTTTRPTASPNGPSWRRTSGLRTRAACGSCSSSLTRTSRRRASSWSGPWCCTAQSTPRTSTRRSDASTPSWLSSRGSTKTAATFSIESTRDGLWKSHSVPKLAVRGSLLFLTHTFKNTKKPEKARTWTFKICPGHQGLIW